MTPTERLLAITATKIMAQLVDMEAPQAAREFIVSSDWRIVISVKPRWEVEEDDGGNDTDMDADILAACDTMPQKLETIARKSGHKPDSYFRARVTRLVRLGRLIRAAKGMYCKPSPDYRCDDDEATDEPVLKQIHQRILAVLTQTPQTIKALARTLGYSLKTTHLRIAVYDLHRWGLIGRTNDGYYRLDECVAT